LGDNTTTCKSSPVSVVGGFTDWCDISVGRNHGLAVRTNGTAWAWGYNCSQLGDNTSVERSSPVSVVGGFTNWCQVRAGTFHSVGSRSNGTVWSWGFNIVGQLGDNSNTTRSSPVSVVGAATDWYKVAAGREHTVALRSTRGFA
jgi:alpha-tubulin suppressor-like RCC1 family protein